MRGPEGRNPPLAVDREAGYGFAYNPPYQRMADHGPVVVTAKQRAQGSAAVKPTDKAKRSAAALEPAAIPPQAATESRSPRAFSTLATVANSGLPSGESAL
jgi:hypothetical protein